MQPSIRIRSTFAGACSRVARIAVHAALLALVTSCPGQVVYEGFQVAVTSDPLPGGQRVSRLQIEFRKESDGRVVPLSTDPLEQSVSVTIPGDVDLSQRAYVLRLSPGTEAGDTVKGAVVMIVQGYSADAPDKPSATWVGKVDVGSLGQTAVHLIAIADGCDADGDGAKNCAQAGCCAQGDEIVGDCDDTPGSGVSASPLGMVPACIPCGQTTDYDCDGTAEACIDSDEDAVADCEEAACGSAGDKDVYPGADEVCDNKDNDCDGETDNGSPDLDGDQLKDCVDDDDDGDNDKDTVDCAPANAAIHHAAEETCDQKDNDCSGETDEGLANCGEWDGDWDGDGRLSSEGNDCNEYDSRVFKGSNYAGCCDPALKTSLDADTLLDRCDFDCDGNATLCAADDKDLDGFKDTSSKDCPPLDKNVYSGAPEKCDDGVDQDCGFGDVSCCKPGVPATTGLVDADGDCYAAGADCDDTNADVHPSAEDTCNGIDDDCNGFVDDGNPGGGEACLHPTQGKGECLLAANQGVRVCAHGLNTATAPTLSKAQSEGKDVAVICVDFFVPPAAESKCDALDEDCDGSTDEDFDWTEKHPGSDQQPIVLGKGDTCGTGECAGGKVICDPADATKLHCTGLDSVATEADGGGDALKYCDNKDNDCDGITDDHSLPVEKTTCLQQGVCLAGATDVKTHCVAGQWECDYADVSNYEPGKEVSCDAFDGDCNGQLNEDLAWNSILFGAACDGVGECGAGVVECSLTAGSKSATCSTNPDGSKAGTTPEVCDKQDDDCDGAVDDGLTWKQDNGTQVPLGDACDGVGQCGVGVVECSATDTVTTCSTNPDGSKPAVKVEICDGIDNDCDGLTDNGLSFNGIELGGACIGVGDCGAGVVECATSGSVTTCSSNPNGTKHKDVDEVCDGKDNDCDGDVDELLVYADPSGLAKLLGESCDGIGECGAGTVVCSDQKKTATCSTNSEGSNPQSSIEICDGKDNDCDSISDDGIVWNNPVTGTAVSLGTPCQGIGKCGNGTAGKVVCSKVKIGDATCSTNPDGTEPRNDPDEFCNGIDDDCNVLVDDVKGATSPGVTCALTGVCNTTNVVATCDSTPKWNCNYTGVAKYEAVEVTCDGLDNDCDGSTDETLTAPNICNVKGICSGLLPACDGPNGWVCHPETRPDHVVVEEDGANCDSKDNDCDGLTDEEFTAPLFQGTPLGATCTRGTSADCQLTGILQCDPATKNSLVCSVTGKAANTACNDGTACTKTDVCSGGETSTCTGTSYTCVPDNLTCTADVCNGDGTCSYQLTTGCLISGVCYSNNVKNPQTDCQRCDTAASTTAWTNIAQNQPCNDLNGCTDNDVCNGAGTCGGTGKICSDAIECTKDECTANVCSFANLKADTCRIAGTCYANGQGHPTNGCLLCDSTKSTSDWSNRANGTSCNDNKKCTDPDSCTAGVCGGPARVCNDNELCTTDACNDANPSSDGCKYTANSLPCATDNLDCTTDACSLGTCAHPLAAGKCKISNACYDSNALNPENDCQKCDVVKSTSAWSNLTATDCEDPDPCTLDDKCIGGAVCKGGAQDTCDDGNDCTSDFCIQGVGCQHISKDGGQCATDNKTCTQDLCVGTTCTHSTLAPGFCLISGTCYFNNDPDPANECRSCQAGTSQTAFTAKVAGTACNADSSGCTQSDSCQSGTCTPGTAANCSGVADECNNGVCNSTSATSYNCGKSPKSGSCSSDGKACTLDQCVAGSCDHSTINANSCHINSVCFVEGDLDPTNDCKACVSVTSKTQYSNRPSGSCAGDGLSCTASTCSGGLCSNAQPTDKCVIDGVCYDSGTPKPTPGDPTHPNLCQTCSPTSSKTQWTNALNTVLCNTDALTCTDQKCNGAGTCLTTPVANTCNIGGVCYAATDRNPANNCQACTPASSTTAWTTLAPTTSCTSDGLACTTDACDAGGVCRNTLQPTSCLIGGVCVAEGSENPGNSCAVCSPANSPNGYWPKAQGSPCPDDGTPCKADECNSGACQHVNLVDGTACPDDGNACKGDVCSAGACVHPNLADTTPCNDGVACTAGDQCLAGTCGGVIFSCAACQTCDGTSCQTNSDKCFIDSTCQNANTLKPADTCEACLPATSKSAWSFRPAASVCYDAAVGYSFSTGQSVGQCLPGTCNAIGTCGGGYTPPAAEGSGVNCGDSFDNDCDGATDLLDSGCP